MSEIEYLYSRGVRCFNFNDDCFGQDRQIAIDVCKAIVDSGLNIAWLTAMRTELATDELLYWMNEAGCHVVALGIESGSPEILKNLNKPQETKTVISSVRAAQRLGMKTYGLLMVGSPGETDRTVRETIDLLKELDLDLYSAVGTVWIYPGTVLERKALAKGMLTRDYWLTPQDGLPAYQESFTVEDCRRWMRTIQEAVPWKWVPGKRAA